MRLLSPVQPVRTSRRILVMVLIFSLLAGTIATTWAWNSDAGLLPSGNNGILTYPAAVVDDMGYVHVAYLVSDDPVVFAANRLYYMRGQITANKTSVSWEQPQLLNTPLVRATRPPAIAVDKNGAVQIVFGTIDESYRYARNELRGAAGGWQYETIAAIGTINAFQPDITLDSDGTPYVVWGEGLGDGSSRLVFTYRIGVGNWSGRITGTSSYYIVRYSKVAVSGTGANATVHTISEGKIHESDSTWRIFYSHGARTGSFSSSILSNDLGEAYTADSPSIVVDPPTGKVFVAYVPKVYDGDPKDYAMRFTYTADGGFSFMQPATLKVGTAVWPARNRLSSDGTYIQIYSHQKFTAGSPITSHIYAQSYTIAAGTTGGFSNFTRISSPSDANSQGPVGGSAGANDFAIWVTNNTGTIKYNLQAGTGGVVPTPDPDASPILANGAKMIPLPNPAKVNLRFTDIKGEANKAYYQWSSAPTSTSLQADTAVTSTIDLPTLDADGCTDATLYTQALRTSDNKTATTVRSAALTIDSAVQVVASIMNPNAPYKNGTFTPLQAITPSSDSGGPNQGASNGDIGYTRYLVYYLGLSGYNECTGSGLKDFAVTKRGVAPTSFTTIPTDTNSHGWSMTLPDSVSTQQGAVPLTLRVRDNAGNMKDIDATITYDSINPVLSAGTLTYTLNPTATILVNLRFQRISVQDAYPTKYWGVWIANSLSAITNPITSTSLKWSAIQVPGGPQNFTIRWSLAADTSIFERTAGPYYIYVRFLDGAGNPTNEVRTVQVKLPAPPTYPKYYLPGIRR